MSLKWIAVLMAMCMMMNVAYGAEEEGEGMPSASDEDKEKNAFSEADKASESDEEDNKGGKGEQEQDSDGSGSDGEQSGSDEEDGSGSEDDGKRKGPSIKMKLKRPFTLQERRLHAIGYTKFLDAQQKVFWHEDSRTLVDAGLKDGMSVLDMGCGPGHLDQMMLGMFPKLKITCVEKDPELATIAKMKMKKYVASGQYTVVEGSVEETKKLEELKEGSFDFVVIRLVLQHVPQPDQVLRNAWSLMKTGGKIVVFEADESLSDWMSIDSNALEDLYGMFEQLDAQLKNHESDPGMGKRLWDLLKENGFGKVASRIESSSSLNDVPKFGWKDFLPMVDTTLLQPLVSAEWITQGRLNRVQKHVEKALQDDDMISVFLMAFWAEKQEKK